MPDRSFSRLLVALTVVSLLPVAAAVTPGVFIDELTPRNRAIEGVATATAAFVGSTPAASVAPQLVMSVGHYAEAFGGPSGFIEAGPWGVVQFDATLPFPPLDADRLAVGWVSFVDPKLGTVATPQVQAHFNVQFSIELCDSSGCDWLALPPDPVQSAGSVFFSYEHPADDPRMPQTVRFVGQAQGQFLTPRGWQIAPGAFVEVVADAVAPSATVLAQLHDLVHFDHGLDAYLEDRMTDARAAYQEGASAYGQALAAADVARETGGVPGADPAVFTAQAEAAWARGAGALFDASHTVTNPHLAGMLAQAGGSLLSFKHLVLPNVVFKLAEPKLPPMPKIDHNSTNGTFYLPHIKKIYLVRGDANDSAIIAHEYGHYLMHEKYGANFSRLPGGSHWAGDDLTTTGGRSKAQGEALAFSEGFATFLGQHLLKTPHYEDSEDAFVKMDLENATLESKSKASDPWKKDSVAKGPGNELHVGALVWDLFDDTNDAQHDDTISIPFKILWKALCDHPASISAYLTALKKVIDAEYAADEAKTLKEGIDKIAAKHGVA